MALRLEGVARKIADQLSSQPSDLYPGAGDLYTLLSHGRDDGPDGSGGRRVKHGYAVLIEALDMQFGALTQERQIQHLMAVFFPVSRSVE